jgi:transcriptional regulator with XRE-family HTH domain
MPDMTMGERIQRTRLLRGYTQEDLATEAGVSVTLIRKLEQGARTTARIDTLHSIARALNITLSDLFSNSGPITSEAETANVWALRRILTPADQPVVNSEDIRALPDLETHLSRAAGAFNRARFKKASASLSSLIGDSRDAVGYYSGDDKMTASRYLAQAYRMAGSLLMSMQHDDLAYWAISKSQESALAADDPIASANATTILGRYLLRQQRFREAEEITLRAAEQNEPSIMKAPPEHLASWGTLLLRASGAASRNNRPGPAREYLNLADTASSRGETGFTAAIAFGPTIVKSVGVENALTEGDATLALRLAQDMRRSESEPVQRWSRHLLAVAEAQTATRNYQGAITTLRDIRALTPEWLRHQGLGHRIVWDLLDATSVRRAKSSGLVDIAVYMDLQLQPDARPVD